MSCEARVQHGFIHPYFNTFVSHHEQSLQFSFISVWKN
ncbi:hypothetical protein FHS45_000779 [Thalassobacillus devorans]|nr:hypothetical protein [Thalassobacillus devorans]